MQCRLLKVLKMMVGLILAVTGAHDNVEGQGLALGSRYSWRWVEGKDSLLIWLGQAHLYTFAP